MAEDKQISLTSKELQAIIATAVREATSAATEKASQGNAQAFEQLAAAILESRKPYVDPNKEKNDKIFRDQMRDQRKRLEESLKRDQERCQHLQGSHELSDFPSPHGLTSIIHHVLDTGELFGICTNCGKVWRSNDPDYTEWVLRKKSGNKTSAAGRRFFANPIAAIEAGRDNAPRANFIPETAQE